ncbi:MAG: hypothetical protein ABIO29_00855 [Sphingomicrobium sp.]
MWKRRFALTTGARLIALLIFFLGIAIAYGDVLRPGGWPQVGAILVILGTLDMVLAPRLLRRMWRRQDSETR